MGLFTGKRPALGVHEGRLTPCPGTPNCVSTQDGPPGRRLEPIPFAGTAAEALALLTKVIADQPRARIVEAGGLYLRAEFTSLVFRFVDDVEFLLDPEARVIHFRSASRLGHSDLGANRRRMERIRAAFRWAAMMCGPFARKYDPMPGCGSPAGGTLAGGGFLPADGFAKRKRAARIALACLVVYLLPFFASWGAGEVDYARVGQGDKPIFARKEFFLRDGGTTVYKGFGYTLTAYHKYMEFDGPASRMKVKVGPRIDYHWNWLWPGSVYVRRTKEDTRMVDEGD
jgi:uncharacterized protein (DUF1499 family)